ncbi:VOC family protein [Chitinophagaceae bacterium LWZ2-11]
MKLRVARHTTDLQTIITFYQNILGLEILGSFKDHNNYDGVFLGIKDENWHLEFTISDELPDHKPDADDLLVFYPKTKEQYHELVTKLKAANIQESVAKNPYWRENGITFLDPDGFGIVIVKTV